MRRVLSRRRRRVRRMGLTFQGEDGFVLEVMVVFHFCVVVGMLWLYE